MKVGIIMLALVAGACTRSPVVPAREAGPSDSGPATDATPDVGAAPDATQEDCRAACAVMAAIGCPEGLAPDCIATCEQIEQQRLIDLDVACLAHARSRADVRQCGVTCGVRDGSLGR